MNKVLCYTSKNREKGDRTPKDTWGSNKEEWNQITQGLSKRVEKNVKPFKPKDSKKWFKLNDLQSKADRFYKTEIDLKKRDFDPSQLNDTRYIAKLALNYVNQLGCDVSVTKGYVVSQIRHQWGLNDLISETDKKERTDHRHHAIDAAVIAATSRSLYKNAIAQIDRDKLKISPPFPDFRAAVEKHLKHIIVSHAPQRKLSGGLHRETGYGYIKNKWLVTRCRLDAKFTKAYAESIVDEAAREIVVQHMATYGYNSTQAFSEEGLKKLKIGKNPIKRVRVLKPKTKFNNPLSLDELQNSKFSVKNKNNVIFKWFDYGNIHHVEILQHKETGKYNSKFVTMMEAHRRAMTGSKSARERNVEYEPIINKEYGNDWQFIMALHKNDMVSLTDETGERIFYRVQKLEQDGGVIQIALNTDAHKATEIPKSNKIRKSISVLVANGLRKHRINAIGVLAND